MNTPKHTPGPWKAHLGVESSQTTLVTAGNKSIARPFDICQGGGRGGIYLQAETYANANLIAAAPDLLEALQFVKKYFWMRTDRGDTFPTQLTNAVEAAIAKAEGRANV